MKLQRIGSVLRTVTAIVWLCAVGEGRAAGLEETFNDALIAEEGRRDYEAARLGYEEVVKQVEEQRRLAATALFRLGEIHRKLGRTNEAVVHYRRVGREFPEQEVLLQLSRQNLQALGQDPGMAPGADETKAATIGPVVVDAEDTEIRRVQNLIANSPDLLNALRGGQAPIHAAAANGWLQVVRYLLSAGANVEVRSSSDWTALQYATEAGHLEVVRTLLDAGATITGGEAPTPLHLAVANRFTRMVELLLERGAPVNLVSSMQPAGMLRTTPLGVAVRDSQPRMAILMRLVDAGADPNFCEGRGCQLPINLARRMEVMELLIRHKADARLALPALQRLVEAGDFEGVELLLKAGCDPRGLDPARTWNVLIDHPKSAPTLPEQAPDFPLAGVLVEHGLNVNPGLLAASWPKRDLAWLTWLLDMGADPRTKDELGRTALELTGVGTSRSDEEFALAAEKVRLLLTKGADPNQRFTLGFHLLHALCLQFNPRILEGQKVDVAVVDSGGRTPLQWAVAAGQEQAVEWLLERGADVNARDHDGATALHYAAAARRLSIVRRLLAADADQNIALASSSLTPGHLLYREVQINGVLPKWAPSIPGINTRMRETPELRTLRELLPIP